MVWIGNSSLWLQQSPINGISWYGWCVLGQSGQRTSVKCAEAMWNYKVGGHYISALKITSVLFIYTCSCASWPLAYSTLICISRWQQKIPHDFRRLSFSSEGGSQIYQVIVNKTATPLFRQQKFWPPIINTPYPLNRLKLYWKQSFWTNTLSVVILWLPAFCSSKILWPPYFSFQKLWPPVYLGPPIPKKMIAPYCLDKDKWTIN